MSFTQRGNLTDKGGIGGRIYSNLFQSIQSAIGMTVLKPDVNRSYLMSKLAPY